MARARLQRPGPPRGAEPRSEGERPVVGVRRSGCSAGVPEVRARSGWRRRGAEAAREQAEDRVEPKLPAPGPHRLPRSWEAGLAWRGRPGSVPHHHPPMTRPTERRARVVRLHLHRAGVATRDRVVARAVSKEVGRRSEVARHRWAVVLRRAVGRRWAAVVRPYRVRRSGTVGRRWVADFLEPGRASGAHSRRERGPRPPQRPLGPRIRACASRRRPRRPAERCADPEFGCR